MFLLMPRQTVTRSVLLVLSLVFLFLPLLAPAKTKYQPLPVRLDHDGERWAQKTLRRMSVEEKVGQLFMIWAHAKFLNIESPEYFDLHDQLARYHVGSFAMTVGYDAPFLRKSEPYEAAALLNRLQHDSRLPLLVAADFELGVSGRLDGTTGFPNAMAVGATGQAALAEAFGRITGEEARAIGVHWNFFPVADVNSNPENPIINTRSFGEDPAEVSELVAAYVRGAHSAGMLATAKHFPGHGDTATDSHLGLAMVSGDQARLERVELPPFEKAIQAGVDSIMIAHVSVPALDPKPNAVASVSPVIVMDLLKRRLGFQGLVITDALDMAGLTRLYSSGIGREAVDAFKAGNDMLLIPPDLDAAYRAILDAIHGGEIPQARLDESVGKILRLKASLGLHKSTQVDIAALDRVIAKPKNVQIGQQIADQAITLVRQSGAVLPLKKTGTTGARLPYQTVTETADHLLLVIVSDDVRLEAGRMLERQIRQRVPDVNVIYTDPELAGFMEPTLTATAASADRVVVAVYAAPTAGKVVMTPSGPRNQVSLPDQEQKLVEKMLAAAGAKTILVAMGNPYLAKDFPAVQNYLCTFSATQVSEISAAKGLFGEIDIRGHLPVTIPGIAARGAGVAVAAQK